MGSLPLTLRQAACWSSSACSPRPWPPPQYLYNYGMYGYPASYYPLGGYADPRIVYNPLYQPGVVNYQPVVQDASAATRGIVKFGNFLEINGEMEQGETLVAGTTPTLSVIKGTFSIQQNGILDLFSNGEAKFKAYIMSSKDLTGMNIVLHVGTGTSCADAVSKIGTGTDEPKQIAMVNVPPSINGFYVSGATKKMAIEVPTPNPNNLETLKGPNKWLLITDALNQGLGCSKAALA